MNALAPWQQIVGVLTATALVLAVAIWARRARQTPGRHRPDQVAVPFVDQTESIRIVIDDGPPPIPMAHFTLGPREPAIDDWTSYLPTEELPVITVRRWLPSEHREHTSPSERARQRWGVECPIFAQLADELGYDSARGFDTQLTAA